MIALVDLDGVLVDFVGGALRKHGRSQDFTHEEIRWDLPEQLGMPVGDFWKPLSEEFWAGLSWMPDGREILNVIERQVGRPNVFLCSSPCLTPGCATGKARWVETHLPTYARRLILTDQKYVFAGPRKVLVDDHDHNLMRWASAGGMVCGVPRPWNELGQRGLPVVDTVVKRLERLMQR